jgi:hypothetical protein
MIYAIIPQLPRTDRTVTAIIGPTLLSEALKVDMWEGTEDE